MDYIKTIGWERHIKKEERHISILLENNKEPKSGGTRVMCPNTGRGGRSSLLENSRGTKAKSRPHEGGTPSIQ